MVPVGRAPCAAAMTAAARSATCTIWTRASGRTLGWISGAAATARRSAVPPQASGENTSVGRKITQSATLLVIRASRRALLGKMLRGLGCDARRRDLNDAQRPVHSGLGQADMDGLQVVLGAVLQRPRRHSPALRPLPTARAIRCCRVTPDRKSASPPRDQRGRLPRAAGRRRSPKNLPRAGHAFRPNRSAHIPSEQLPYARKGPVKIICL